MPNPNNKFKNGKQGLFGANEQYNLAIATALLYMDQFNPQAAQKMRRFRDNTQNNSIQVPENEIRNTTNHVFRNKFRNEASAENAYKKMGEFKKSLAELNVNPEDNSRQFSGYLKLAEKLLDTDSGDFGKALSENPYLSNMLSMVQKGPKIDGNIPIQTSIKYLQNTEPGTNRQKTGPLYPLNIFMSTLSDLLDREYEKQKINEDYTAEKEEAYLKKLKEDFTRIIENHKAFDSLVEKDGNSVYDAYLNGPLDVMTGKNKNHPTCQNNIENIKGQKQAIQNGWGMNELGVLGSLSELKYFVDIQKAQALQQNPENEEERKKKERFEEFSKKLDALYTEAMATSIFQPSDKVLLTERYNDLLAEAEQIDNPVIRKQVGLGKAATKEAMEFGGIQPVHYEYSNQIITDRIVEGEKASEYNPLFCLNSKTMVNMNLMAAIFSQNHHYFFSISDKYDEEIEKETRENRSQVVKINSGYLMGPPIRSVTTSQTTEFSSLYSPEKNIAAREKKASTEAIKKYHYFAGKQLLENRKEIRELSGINSLPLTIADIEKGETLTAMIEQPVLSSFFVHGCTFNPYQELNGGAILKQWMEERNLTKPAIRFYESGKELFEAEFEKQRLRKNGWDEKKEKLYIAKVCESIDKMQESFEPLKNASLEAQSDNSVLIQNKLGHMTGTDSSFEMRDLRPEMTAVGWVKEGLKKGWNSSDIQFLHNVGMLEGMIERIKIRLKLRAEESARNKNPNPVTNREKRKEKNRKENEEGLRELYQLLTEFQENQVKDFKENLFRKKITSPADKLAAIAKIEGFFERYKNYDFLNRDNTHNVFYNVFEGIKSAKDFFIPRLKNQCIEEIRKAKAEGKDLTVDKDRDFAVVQNTETMRYTLQTLRNRNINFHEEVNEENRERLELERTWCKTAAVAYFKNRMQDGMYKDAHPELFDSKHPDYAVVQHKLDFYLNEYVDHIMKVMNPANPAELADVLEFGGHYDVMSIIPDKLKADAQRGRLTSFIMGRPERCKKDPSMEGAIHKLENSPAFGFSSSDLYDNILKDMKKLEQMKNDLASELRRKYGESSIKMKIIGYGERYDRNLHRYVEDPTKPKYEFTFSEEVKVDFRKLKALSDLQVDVYKRINTYINNKKAIIRQNGGNPDNIEDASRLGTNGERRYKSMLDAKKAVLNQNLATVEFNNNGPSMLDILREKEKGIIPSGVNPADEKKKFESNVKFNMLKESIELQKKLAEVLDKEIKEVAKLCSDYQYIREKYNIIKAELAEAKKAYDDDLLNSEMEGRDVKPEIKQNFEAKKTALQEFKQASHFEDFEQYQREYEEKLSAKAERCLYSMTILDYPFKGVVRNELTKLDDELAAAERTYSEYQDKRNELDGVLANFGGKMENAGTELYTVSVPGAKYKTFKIYLKNRPEFREKIDEFYRLQGELARDKENLENLRQSVPLKKEEILDGLEKMHKDIDCGFAPKLAVDLLKKEEIRNRTQTFRQLVGDIVVQGENGPEFNQHSEQFETFRTGVLNKSPYKEEFKKNIIEKFNTIEPTAKEIRKVSDNILKTTIQRDFRSAEKMESLNQIATALDSDIRVMKEVEKLQPQIQNPAQLLNQPQPHVQQQNPQQPAGPGMH